MSAHSVLRSPQCQQQAYSPPWIPPVNQSLACVPRPSTPPSSPQAYSSRRGDLPPRLGGGGAIHLHVLRYAECESEEGIVLGMIGENKEDRPRAVVGDAGGENSARDPHPVRFPVLGEDAKVWWPRGFGGGALDVGFLDHTEPAQSGKGGRFLCLSFRERVQDVLPANLARDSPELALVLEALADLCFAVACGVVDARDYVGGEPDGVVEERDDEDEEEVAKDKDAGKPGESTASNLRGCPTVDLRSCASTCIASTSGRFGDPPVVPTIPPRPGNALALALASPKIHSAPSSNWIPNSSTRSLDPALGSSITATASSCAREKRPFLAPAAPVALGSLSESGWSGGRLLRGVKRNSLVRKGYKTCGEREKQVLCLATPITLTEEVHPANGPGTNDGVTLHPQTRLNPFKSLLSRAVEVLRRAALPQRTDHAALTRQLAWLFFPHPSAVVILPTAAAALLFSLLELITQTHFLSSPSPEHLYHHPTTMARCHPHRSSSPNSSFLQRLRALRCTSVANSCNKMADDFNRILVALARRRYKREGWGSLYITSRVDKRIQNAYDAGQISLETYLDHLEVKVGHSYNVEKRRHQYKNCARQQVLIWHYHFAADRRILAERLIHLALDAIGAERAIRPCPGCKTSHVEYYKFRSVGSFERLNHIITSVLKHLGQRGVRARLVDDALGGGIREGEAEVDGLGVVYNFVLKSGLIVAKEAVEEKEHL
ncbi:hypothetical protein B0H16DRAFT_1831905 [Mycena metata]|uniref:Bacteriophage T5 Orf172 DNA-binding domain-containing protein n=1 Tax=Mycena metata TaxID=1033252 RepID=A0AAD7E1E5_9AGAR|nr:hypothetical protein B0H16DRAFT_1831905 [Mycena metata]